MAGFAVIKIFQATAVLNFLAVIVPLFGVLPADAGTSTELIEDPEDVHLQLVPSLLPANDDWKDWETWEASPDVVTAFPFYKMGYDLDGLPVYVFEFGKWDFREWAHQSDEKVDEFWKYYEQMIKRQAKDAAVNNGGGVVEFIDFDGFSLSHHASPKAIKLAMRVFAGLLRVNEYVSYGFIVNVNFAAETFINTARPFLSNYLDKIEIYGTRVNKWKPMILRKIGVDQLAPKYGGNSSWEPVPFTHS